MFAPISVSGEAIPIKTASVTCFGMAAISPKDQLMQGQERLQRNDDERA
jgi:hypothetical protein